MIAGLNERSQDWSVTIFPIPLEIWLIRDYVKAVRSGGHSFASPPQQNTQIFVGTGRARLSVQLRTTRKTASDFLEDRSFPAKRLIDQSQDRISGFFDPAGMTRPGTPFQYLQVDLEQSEPHFGISPEGGTKPTQHRSRQRLKRRTRSRKSEKNSTFSTIRPPLSTLRLPEIKNV